MIYFPNISLFVRLSLQYEMTASRWSVHVTRLINQYSQTGIIKKNISSPGNGFKQKYITSDIDMLIKMDERYGTPSGAVIKKLFEHIYEQKSA